MVLSQTEKPIQHSEQRVPDNDLVILGVDQAQTEQS